MSTPTKPVGLNVTYPKYVQQGTDFDVVTLSGDTVVPTEASGITVINLKDIKIRTRFDGGFSIVSAAAVAGTGSYKTDANARPTAIPGGVSITIDGAQHVLMQMPGPFRRWHILSPPQLRITLHASGAPGTKITSRFAGTIPADLAPPFADYGFIDPARQRAGRRRDRRGRVLRAELRRARERQR